MCLFLLSNYFSILIIRFIRRYFSFVFRTVDNTGVFFIKLEVETANYPKKGGGGGLFKKSKTSQAVVEHAFTASKGKWVS